MQITGGLMNILSFGGSGVGFELAREFAKHPENTVCVAGTQQEKVENCNMQFEPFYINHSSFIDPFMTKILTKRYSERNPVDLVILGSGGFYASGSITQTPPETIRKMLLLGIELPVRIVQQVLAHSRGALSFIFVGSVSQDDPRESETMYCAVKAATVMFAQCVAMNPGVTKTLVVAPARLRKAGCESSDPVRERAKLDPEWIARESYEQFIGSEFRYRCIKFTRNPPRMTIRESRI